MASLYQFFTWIHSKTRGWELAGYFVSEFLKNVPTLLRYRNSTLSFKSKMTIFQTQEEEITLEKIKKWPSFLPLGTNLLETTCVNISSCAVFSFPDHRAIFPDQTPKCQRLMTTLKFRTKVFPDFFSTAWEPCLKQHMKHIL